MTKSPNFEPVLKSKYPLPEDLKIECGYLTVPESRSASSGNFPSNKTLRIYSASECGLSRSESGFL
jgi:hypothetical protein